MMIPEGGEEGLCVFPTEKNTYGVHVGEGREGQKKFVERKRERELEEEGGRERERAEESDGLQLKVPDGCG